MSSVDTDLPRKKKKSPALARHTSEPLINEKLLGRLLVVLFIYLGSSTRAYGLGLSTKGQDSGRKVDGLRIRIRVDSTSIGVRI
jgi:hypothetical protein